MISGIGIKFLNFCKIIIFSIISNNKIFMFTTIIFGFIDIGMIYYIRSFTMEIIMGKNSFF
jgi:hypothetical protein